nr:MAG: rhodanese-like domain-containing protein [Pseudomonadota bacterium]
MLLVACMLMLVAGSAVAARPAASIPAEKLVQPADWAARVKDGSSAGTLMLHVGFRTMFDQAHIPGSEYAGPGNSGAGLQVLRERVAGLQKDTPILIYCGCCPWDRCPNMAGAYDALVELGFTHVQAMIIENNFGADWVEKGYPTARTE